MKRLNSIFTDDMDHCYFTGSADIERHHVFGGFNRKRSERYGFIIPLRKDLHPNGVFAGKRAKELDIYMKQECQKWYEKNVGTREDFIAEFGRSYL